MCIIYVQVWIAWDIEIMKMKIMRQKALGTIG